jgi:alcohol dehydrogenase class IV
MDYSFLSPLKIIVGENESLKLNDYIGSDKKVLIFHGNSMTKNDTFKLIKQSIAKKIALECFILKSGEPSPKAIDDATKFAKKISAQVIVGIGGGSVMDIAKAVAALCTNKGETMDYLEGVGNGKKLKHQPLMFIAIPTTAGTGTEVTKNAVVSSVEKGFKVSMRDDRMIADVTIIDYKLSMGLPKTITAYSGMDAICQLVESYTTKAANSITDALSLHHTKLAVDAIKRAYDRDDETARETMAISAMVSGLCLANVGLGMAHGIAAGLGATLGVAHGFACGLLLPHVMAFNYQGGVTKYADIAEVIYNQKFEDKDEGCKMAIGAISDLNAHLNIPADLKGILKSADIEKVAKASMGSSMTKNPISIKLQDCIALLEKLV